MRVTVDPNLCEANALCVAEAPGVFELSDDEGVDIPPAGTAAREKSAVTGCRDRLSEADAEEAC